MPYLFTPHGMQATLRVVVAAFALSLASCALKDPPASSDLKEQALPNLKLPAQWTARGTDGAVEDEWIAALGDPQLPLLVAEAIANNPDMRVAAARLEQAAAGVKAAGGQALPAIELLARTSGKMGGDSSGLGGWVISASWELDLWGRVRYGKRAAEDQYASTEADAIAASQSLAAMVARAWFVATEARLQRQLALEMIAASERLSSIARDRERVGAGSDLDIALAQARLQALRDAERQLELAERQALRSLEVLLGRYPAAQIGAATSFSTMPPSVSTGVPSQLLERRPDVIAAQRRVNVAFNRVGEADAARLPRISLTAAASSISSDIFLLQDRNNPVVGVGANLFAPLFMGGQLEAQAEARRAEQKQAMAAWAQVGLRAFNEVESALASEATLRAREPLLAAQVAESQKALSLETDRYRVGSRDLRTVTTQQLEVYSARTSLLRVQTEQRIQRVNLYLALGGGFGPPARLAAADTAQSPH